MSAEPTLDDRKELDFLLRAFQISRICRAAADLKVADRVPIEGSLSIDELARECRVQDEPLRRILRLLASVNIFAINSAGEVTHTPRSRLLRTDRRDSMHYAARFWTAQSSWRAWEYLDVALSGSVPHEAAWKLTRFAYLQAHPEEARVFDEMMQHFPDQRHQAIAASYDFSSHKQIVDVGGGNGEVLREILRRFPATDGILFDREDVIAAMPKDEDRLARESGSFFERVPKGADCYLLVRVLHDWSDDDCLRILKRCQKAMPPSATLLICEQLLKDDPSLGTPSDYLIDTQMLAMFGHGRERTASEFRTLLEKCGFAFKRVIATQSIVSLIEAVRA
ncbi:MAG: methyltransferase [Hyphomicrobiales bacterium]|nr:methyltransferase [Hyphomicrobiales bacterium]